MKIIDAHMHPFSKEEENLKWYGEKSSDFATIKEDMERAGIPLICGSVIIKGKQGKEALIGANESALSLYKENPDFYLPGIVIHPEFKEESCEYIKKAHDMGLKLIGELTPYTCGWKCYMSAQEIFEYADSLDMTVSCHPTPTEDMHKFAESFPNMEIVYAHPGEHAVLEANIEILKKYDNTYIDLSGSGVQRYGTIRKLINEVGKERILFGTDYPICNPATYISAMLYENLTDDELEHIFYKNAERVYGIG